MSDTIYWAIKEILLSLNGANIDEITLESDIIELLSYNSILAIEFIVELETHYEIELDEIIDDFTIMNNMSRLVNLVQSKV